MLLFSFERKCPFGWAVMETLYRLLHGRKKTITLLIKADIFGSKQ